MTCLKVNFCAAPSSRKTTVCAGLESKLKQNRIEADSSREYARQYINTYGLPRDLNEQLTIFENQDTREHKIAGVSQVLLSDAPCAANYVFSVRMLDNLCKERGESGYSRAQYKFLEEMFLKSLRKCHWFDLIFVFDPPTEVVDDGTRKENLTDAWEIHDALIGFLNSSRIPYIHYTESSVNDRIDACFNVIMEKVNESKTHS